MCAKKRKSRPAPRPKTLRKKKIVSIDAHPEPDGPIIASSHLFDAIQSLLYLQQHSSNYIIGTRHFVLFPLSLNECRLSKSLNTEPSNKAFQNPFARPFVLCVEDHPIYLDLRRKVLEKEGYRVIGVTSANSALEALREAPVCCIIADHMLHGSTGVELAAEMKKIRPDVPIILFSGTMPERLGNVDVYVNKGEPTVSFLKIVRDVVERYWS